MNPYHLDLLEHSLKKALERYCLLCDTIPERQYLSSETVFSQTKEIIGQYLKLFQALGFLDEQTEYYEKGFILTYHPEESETCGDYPDCVHLIKEVYECVAGSVSRNRFFLPIHIRQISSNKIHLLIGVVTKEQHHYTISVVAHETVFPHPPASIGNNRYLYLLPLLKEYALGEQGSLKIFLSSKGLYYRKVQKDSLQFFGSTFYHHYLKLKMIPALEDLLLSTGAYKEIAYQNDFSGYYQLYTLFHKTYHFPFHRIPRIALEK